MPLIVIDPQLMDILVKFTGFAESELVYPKVVFSVLLPAAANIVCFYGLHSRLQIFGRGSVNDVISVVLALIFTYFVVRLGFIGYAAACIGIGFLFLKNDFARLGFVFLMLGLYQGLKFVLV